MIIFWTRGKDEAPCSLAETGSSLGTDKLQDILVKAKKKQRTDLTIDASMRINNKRRPGLLF
jgi:hypothetical protein